MHISQIGVDLITHFEGLKLESHQDPTGQWTIGYGHRNSDLGPNKVITEHDAEEILQKELEVVENAIRSLVKVDIDQNQFDALASLAFNIGLPAFKKSTVLKALNKGDVLTAAEAITWWNKATINNVPQEILGLTRRRAAEAALFLEKGDVGEAGPIAQDSTYVRPEENPPRRRQLIGSRTIQGGLIAGAAGALGAGAALIPKDNPKSHPITGSTNSSGTGTLTIPTSSIEMPVSSIDRTGFKRNDYIDGFQLIAWAIVILAGLYIIYSRVDDWLKFRR